MKKRKRILCALMAAMMLLALVPAPALATGSSPDAPQKEIYLGGEQEANENTNGVTGDAEENLDAAAPAADAPLAEVTSYDLWVSGVRVTSENMHDVLNNGGSVVFTPAADGEPNKLTLTNASITGAIDPADIYWCAGIYGDVDLTLELVGKSSITVSSDNAWFNAGIRMLGRELTVIGDGSLSIEALYGLENRGIEAASVIMQSGTLNVTSADSRTPNHAQATSLAVAAALTVNGGSLTATAGAAKNGSYGISDNSVTINGGRVIASGQVGAYRNAPDLSGYTGREVKVSANANGASASNWNGTDALTGFKYVKIAPLFANYDLWVGGVRVTSENMHDVLNNGGKVVFTPAANGKPHTLKLTNASISGPYSNTVDPEWCAGIYGKLDLTLELVGESSVVASNRTTTFDAGICMKDNELTVIGDGSLSITVISGLENRGVEAAKMVMQSGTVNVIVHASRDAADPQSSCYGISAALTVNGGSLNVTAGNAARGRSYGIIGSPIKINGGTVEAFGLHGAYKNAPDYSGYVEPYITVGSLSSDAVPWNGTTALTLFYYVKIAPSVKYDLWVGSVRVTELNMRDVLNNGGSVVFTPAAGDKPSTLTLTNASITGEIHPVDLQWCAGIYGDIDLTLELVGTNSITVSSNAAWFNAGIRMCGRELTVTGDGSLTISALRGRENRGIEAERVLMQSGTLNVISADSRTPEDQSTSHAVNATLTVNGGSLNAMAGAAKNGSYGIIGSPIKINGGTVEASGQSGAYRNAPYLSGYADPYVKVSANADGADAAVWNGTDTLTGFKYVRVAPPVSYDLWVGGVQVTSANMRDVLNNGGSVVFTPAAGDKPNTLTLTDANIRGTRISATSWVAGIYGDIDLTLELVGTNTIYSKMNAYWFSAGICMLGRKLTVTGDGSLSIEALSGVENRGVEVGQMLMQSGTVNIISGDSREPNGDASTSHAVNGALTVNGGSLTATAGAGANGSYGVIGSPITINGGTVIASGQSGAYKNAPDLSGYDEPAVKVSASADGADAAAWNETDALTGFKYVSIAPALVKYDLWIGSVRVTELNMHDVLGDGGSVVFTPAANGEPNKLTLTDASITGAIYVDIYWCAGIYGDIDLTLELVGTNSITADDYDAWFNAGIRMLGRELTVTGDGSLSMSVLSGVENRGIEAASVIMQSGTLNVTSADSLSPTNEQATSHAVNAALTVNGGTLTATAGEAQDGSYGIIGSLIIINDGTVVASGQTGAYKNAPDLSGYAEGQVEPDVTVSASADGANAAAWDGTAALTGFKYVSIAPPLVEYGVWVGGVQVTSKNMHDVLGDDGSVVFTPAAGDNPHTLTLTDASITGADHAVDDEIWNVGIANGMHLTLELKGSSTVTAGNAQAPVSAGLFASEESITVVGDGTLTVTGGSAARVSAGFLGRALYVKKGAVIARGGSAAEKSVGVYAEELGVVSNGTVIAEGGSAAESIGVMAYYIGMTAGCTVVASGQTAALPSQELGYSFDYDFGGDFVVTVSANADGSDAQIWEAGMPPFNDSRFKYVSIVPPLVEYDVWVGGVQVTSKNRRDVFGDAAENGGTPTVVFTPAANGEPNKLTLTNASITGAQIPGMFTDYSYGIYSANEQTDLRLELVGENTVTGADTRISYGIMLAIDSKLTIAEKGVGSLTASGGEAIRYSCGVDARWLVVESGTVRAYGGKADDYSRGAYVHLTLNGGYFSAVGGEAENSYGLQNYTTFTKAHHSITGGTLEACGNSGALASDISGEQNLHWAIPDFYGYGEPYVKVSMSADGANAQEWNGTTALTNFNYVKILPHIVRYDLWVSGVRVTSENMYDVLNNGGKVRFTPAANGKPNTLTLTDANIRGGGGKETEYWVAGIYGKLDLTLELVGTNTIKSNMNAYWFSAGICMLGRELTVTGDGSLRIEALSGMENRGVEAASVIMQSGTVNIISGDSSEPNYSQATSHAVNGALTVNGGLLTATAGAAKNGSYGIIGSPIKINGGTVEASGQSGAYNNAPDLSGYAGREVKVSASADGADAQRWNGTDALTGFKYVRISPPFIDYGVLVGDVEVTSENMHDVFGDADKNGGTPTVRFTPAANGKPHKLTLTNANIVGAAKFAVAAILAEGVDLELELCGENRIYMPTRAGYIHVIYIVAGDLTVSGDGSLDITMGELDYYESAGIVCEKVTVESGTVRVFGGNVRSDGMSFGVWTGRLVINGGSLTAVGGDAQDSFGVAFWEVAEIYSYGGKDRDEEYIPAGSGLVINGGTLEARGKTAALTKSPDLSGYDEPYVTVSESMDGYDSGEWDGVSELTDFRYVKIAPEAIVEYDLWISGVRVTEQNMGNILGETKNGTPTASFDPETNTLTLNDIEITREGMHTVDHLTSGIFADGMELRIEGSGKMSLSDDCQFSVLMWNRNGEPSLTLCGDFDFRGGLYGLDVHGNLVFEGGAVKAHNISAGSVYFRGGTVDAYSNHEAFYAVKGLRGIELDRLMRIELPVDGQIVRYDTTGMVGYVIEGGESWTEHVRIAPRPKAETEIELSCEPLTCSPGETVTVTLTLREKNGRLIRGAEVELDIDAIGEYPLLRTDADGTATYSFIAPAEDEHWMTATYYGDAMRTVAQARAVVYVTSETVTVRLHDPVGVVPEGTSLIVPKGIWGGSIFEGQNEWLVRIGDQAPEMYFFRGWELFGELPRLESRGEQAMRHIEEEDSWKERPVMEDIDLVAIWEEYPIIESVSMMLNTRIAGLSAAEISAEDLLSVYSDAPYYIYTSALYMKPLWRDANGEVFTGVFEEGKTYRVSAWIQTYEDSAYRFLGWRSGEKLPLYLNGEEKAWDGMNYGSQIYVSVPFTPLPQDQPVAEVDRVEIELLYAAPRVGEPIPVMPNVRVNGAEAIVVNTRMMMEINGEPAAPPANTYGVGRYAVKITLAPNLRYSFAENVTVDVTDMNGESYHAIIQPNSDGTLTFYGQSHEAIESELFAIAVRGGTASAARAAAGETVTLTADEAENGYEFVRWQVNYPETLELDASASPVTGFIMPEGEVSVTAVFARLGNITLALTDEEGGAPVEFAVHKILRWKGMDHASTGEPTEYGYDPTDTGSALTVLSGGAPVPYSDEVADIVLDMLMNAEYARYTQNGFGTLSLRGGEGAREFVLVGVVNGVDTELMSVTVGERGGYVHAEVCSLAPGFVRMTLDGTEYAFATPGDVNLDGRMNAIDWISIMHWTLQGSTEDDTKPSDSAFEIKLNEETYNLWILLADMTGTDTGGSAVSSNWNTMVNAVDWITIMQLTLQAWKE